MAANSITTKDVLARLKQRCGQEFAVLTEVANGTGAKQTRWADALGMSLWPSRGVESVAGRMHGFLWDVTSPSEGETEE